MFAGQFKARSMMRLAYHIHSGTYRMRLRRLCFGILFAITVLWVSSSRFIADYENPEVQRTRLNANNKLKVITTTLSHPRHSYSALVESRRCSLIWLTSGMGFDRDVQASIAFYGSN